MRWSKGNDQIFRQSIMDPPPEQCLGLEYTDRQNVFDQARNPCAISSLYPTDLFPVDFSSPKVKSTLK